MEQPRILTATRPAVEAQTVFLAKVFNWMAIGLLLTAISSFVTANSPALLNLVFGNRLVFFALIAAELAVVFSLVGRTERLSAGAATGLFIGYALLNGVTLASIVLYYTMTSVATTFLVTSAMFGSMAVYGLVTKRDLSSLGSFLMMGLVGIILASLVNLFLGSPMVSWLISAIGVIVFTGLAAYDVQKLSQLGASGIMAGGEAVIRRTVIVGALTLYLDFINLFLMLLRFFGSSRE